MKTDITDAEKHAIVSALDDAFLLLENLLTKLQRGYDMDYDESVNVAQVCTKILSAVNILETERSIQLDLPLDTRE